MEGHVAKGDKILIVCSGEDKLDESKSIVEKLSNLVGDGGEVFVEKISQVIQSKHKTSSFSKCFYGYIDKKPSIKPLGGNVLEDLVRIVIPNGRLFVKKSTEEDCSTASFIAQLKFAGFVDVKESRDEIVCNKPDYEVGSKVSIETGKVEGSTKIWQLAADNLLDDDELIDDDSLLTEDDLKKPDPESLRVCGTTGKRKACANCSCGLADELANEEKGKIQSNVHNAKSSCGSCYLGDAFRCASCPYLGMPAFKPGEKVTIDPTSDL